MRDQKKTLNDIYIPLTTRVLQNEIFHAGEDSKTKYAGWVMASSGSPSWLVTPECTILRIRSIAALENLIDARKIDRRFATNLRQLLDFTAVGSDRRTRHRAGQWFSIEAIQWMLNEQSGLVVPLMGTMRERLAKMQQHEPDINTKQMELLLNKKRKAAVGMWHLLRNIPFEPQHGQSILGISLGEQLKKVPIRNIVFELSSGYCPAGAVAIRVALEDSKGALGGYPSAILNRIFLCICVCSLLELHGPQKSHV